MLWHTFDLVDVNVTDLCLSNTAGHIDVGGKIILADSPREHSAFTDAAHRLCSYSNVQRKMLVLIGQQRAAEI